MKVKRSEFFNLLAGFEKVKNLSGVKFSYVIAKNKKKIQEELQTMQEALNPTEKYKEYDNKRVILCEKYSDKNKEGKPVIINDSYAGLTNNKEFDKELKKLQEEYKEAISKREKQIEEYSKMLNEEIEFDLYKIPLDVIPDNITVEQLDLIALIIQDEELKK